MKHLLVGKFDKNELENVEKKEGYFTADVVFLQNESSLGFGMDNALRSLFELGVFPSEIGFDLLILAFLVYCADTRIDRSVSAQDGWTREIFLNIPVSDLVLWSRQVPLITKMLKFLTGDRWMIEFRSRPEKYKYMIPTHLLGTEKMGFDKISLFSGGLDSLIGAINSVESGKTPLFVSHASDGTTKHCQNVCFNALSEKSKDRNLSRIQFWTGIPKSLIRPEEVDPNQRSRSFMFFAIGIFAGTGLKVPFPLEAPENGLIAINAPLDPLRVGSLSTRTMHPFYLARWNELLENLGIPGKIVNPYWAKTKGEMVTECLNKDLLQLILPNSLSCSSPTKGRYSHFSTMNCGYCLPCLIRRAGIEKAFGTGNDPSPYTSPNLRAHRLVTYEAEGQNVRSVQFALARLRSNPHLVKLLIRKPGPLSDLTPREIGMLEDVYQRGMNEVGVFLEGVIT